MTGFANLILEMDLRDDPPQALLDLLGSTLRSRMQKLDVWDKPPILLGYPQFPCWSEPKAFGQLLGDCYDACIRFRFATLKARSDNNGTLDSQIKFRIDQFLVNFTNLIRPLEPGVEPPIEVIEKLLDLLKKSVRRQLKKSNFLDKSPRKLGVYSGRTGWREPEAMNELVNDAYGRAIAGRLDWLKSRIEAGHGIDACVHRDVRRTIIERWRKYSPHEYKLFKNPETVIREMEQSGQVFVSPLKRNNKGKILLKPESLVSFSNTEQTAATDELILSALRNTPRWALDVADLILGKRAKEVITATVFRMRQYGIPCFRFGDFCSALRSEFESEVGLPRQVDVPEGLPGTENAPAGAEEPLWDTKSVHRAIDERPGQAKVRELLHEIETIQYESVSDGKAPPGPTEIGRRLGLKKTTAGDYVNRLQAIRSDVHLDQ